VFSWGISIISSHGMSQPIFLPLDPIVFARAALTPRERAALIIIVTVIVIAPVVYMRINDLRPN
jgi:hypothetical protein